MIAAISGTASAATPKEVHFGGSLACAAAVANTDNKKAGGWAADDMIIACSTQDGGRAWLCLTSSTKENVIEQTWSLTSVGKCNATTKDAGCVLRTDNWTLVLTFAFLEESGLVKLRLDMDFGGASVGAKVCAGSAMRSRR